MMQSRPAWVQILSALEEHEQNGTVLKWQVDGLDVWPIVKSKLNIIALQSALSFQRARQGFFERHYINFKTRQQKKRRRHPVPGSQITDKIVSDSNSSRKLWCVGNAVPTLPTSHGYAHGHFDAYRLLAENNGLDHWGLFYREEPGNAHITKALVGPNSGFGDLFSILKPERGVLTDENWETSIAALAEHPELKEIVGKNHKVLGSTIVATISIRNVFRAIFEKRQPKLILCFNYYQNYGWGLCAAAKEAGIRVLDIQHGAHGRYHHAYHWQSSPRNGWNCIPEGFILYDVPPGSSVAGYKSYSSMPSWYLWCRLAYGAEKNLKVSSAWTALGNRLLDDSRDFWSKADAREKPWLLSTPFSGESNIYWKSLEALVQADVHILSRRHPAGNHRRTQSEKLPIATVLAGTDGLVTGNSASVLEAAAMGLTSFVTSDNALLFYDGAPLVRLASDPEGAARELRGVTRVTTSSEKRFFDSVTRNPLPLSWLS